MAKVSNMSRAHLSLLFFGKMQTTVSVAEELRIQRGKKNTSFVSVFDLSPHIYTENSKLLSS